MIIFDYKCPDCGCIFEEDSRLNTIECPRCNKTNCEKKFTKANFILKGKGFYKTDSEKTTNSKGC